MWIARKKPDEADRGAVAAKSRRPWLVSLLGLALLLAPGLVWALITGTWTINGSTSANTTVNGITVTLTGPSDGNYANNTLNTTNYWSNPYGDTVAGGASLVMSIFGDTTTRTYTVTFSKPVNNPVLHIDRLGGYSSGANSSIWTLGGYTTQSGSVSMTRLSGNTQFVMPTVTSFRRDAGTASSTQAECTTASGTSNSGTACGSIRFNGTGITSLTFQVAMSSNAGSGDALEMRWSFDGSKVIVKKQSNGGTGTFGFTNGGGLSAATYNLNTATANPATSSTYPVTNHANAITVTESTQASNFGLTGVSCVDQDGDAVASTLNTGTRALTIAAGAYDGNQTITCTFVNSRATLTVNKVSVGGTGTFSFTGTNGVASHNITTASSGVAVAGATQTLTTPGTATTVTEGVPPTGYVLSDIVCTGLGAGGTATPNLSTRTVSLNAAATAVGSAIVCTFTNQYTADLSIIKTNNATALTSGSDTTYVVTVTNNGPGAFIGAVVADTPSTGLTCPGSNIITCTGSGCPASPNPITVDDVRAGLVLGMLTATAPGNTVVLTGTCTVD